MFRANSEPGTATESSGAGGVVQCATSFRSNGDQVDSRMKTGDNGVKRKESERFADNKRNSAGAKSSPGLEFPQFCKGITHTHTHCLAAPVESNVPSGVLRRVSFQAKQKVFSCKRTGAQCINNERARVVRWCAVVANIGAARSSNTALNPGRTRNTFGERTEKVAR